MEVTVGTVINSILKVLEAISPIVAVMVSTGLVVKYAPFLKWFPNEAIRLLNGLVGFFIVLGGTATPANAGVFADAINQIGVWGKLAGSLLLAHAAQWIYENHLRSPIEKIRDKISAGL